ncbi:MAG: MopE-related protein [Pseudomonadota bacterium]|nr:MopE-related protein [Pseudomonadota bacterium]
MSLRPALLLLLGLGACSWVGAGDFEKRLLEVDDDADGVAAANDCNDHDASISPAVIEVWYDGIDQRCDGGDDFDADLDGYVPTEHVGRETAGVPGSGALPGNDCDDAEPLVSPQQPDTWYDGKDQDCDGADDYDQDADGFVRDADLGLPTTYVTGSGVLPGGDCDDLLPTVAPGARDDWYDGVDSDCGGEDDYDQDGDRFIPDEWFPVYAPTTYVSGSGNLPNGDCDDLDGGINPAAADDWYDDIDSDCAGDDDFDQDLDGFSDPRDPRGGGDDCDDGDDSIFPGGLEILADTDDSDCDGGNDTFALESISGFAWEDPHSPVFDESTDRVYLSIAATQIDTGSTLYYDSAVALLWFNSDVSDGRDGVAAWSASTTNSADYVLGAGQGFIASDDYLYGVVSLDYTDHRALRLVRYDVDTGSRFAANANGTDGYAAYDDISIALDSTGALHAVACDDDTEVLQYVRVPSTFSGGFAADVETAAVGAADCAVDLHYGEAHIYTSERGGIWDYAFDGASEDPIFTGVELTSAYAPLDLDIPADWTDRVLVMADATSDAVVLLDATGSATSIVAGVVPLETDVYQDAGGTYYVAYTTAGGEAHLAWGTAMGGFTTIQLVTPFAVEDVSVWVSGGHVMYGAVGATDVAVGIAQL